MKRLALFLALLALPAFAFDPTIGRTAGPQLWHYTTMDSAIGTTWGRVAADTGFTQIPSGDTIITAMYAGTNKLDSLRAGNPGAGAIGPVYTGASSADTSGALFFRDVGQVGTIDYVAPGVTTATYPAGTFAAPSGVRNYYEVTWHASSLDLVSGGWAQTVWARGMSPGNPGINTTQIVWARYASPDVLQLGFNQQGRPFARISDDALATLDSVGIAADLYDSTWHLFTVSLRANTLHLKADLRAEASAAISNASSALTTDTLMVFGYRAGSIFWGQRDELYLADDSVSLDTMMHRLMYERGRANLTQSADSAKVYLVALRSDTTYVRSSPLTVRATTPVSTTAEFIAYERAYLDTAEHLPVVVYSNPVSPRSSMLDSIRVGKIQMPKAVIVVPEREELRIHRVNAGVFDAAEGDEVEFQTRVYPQVASARGAGNVGRYFEPLPRLTPNADHVHVSAEGPWTVIGPAIVEGWARATDATSRGYLEYIVERVPR